MPCRVRHAGRFGRGFAAIGLFFALIVSAPSLASMTWSARAIDPATVSALKKDDRLLEQTLYGEPAPLLAEKLKTGAPVNLSDKQIRDELSAWATKRTAEVGDTEVDLDKAWHGIHYLLTGSADSNNTVASKVIMGGQDIGPDNGYGAAQLLKPAEVKAIAKLLEATTPEVLRQRYKPQEMTRAQIYPGVIWERDGDKALDYVLKDYEMLVAFYKRAAERGQAVIHVIS